MIPYSAFGFITGIITHDSIDIYFAIVICAVACLVAIVLCFIKSRIRGIDIFFIAVFFLIGNVYGRLCADVQRRPLYSFISSHSVITAKICDMPVKSGENYKYTVEVNNIIFDSNEHRVKERMLITSPNSYNFGDDVTFVGVIKPIDGAMNEYGFDAAKYYKSKGIYFKAYSIEDALSSVQSKSFSLLTPKIKICHFIDRYFTGDKGAILKAVLTGYESSFSNKYDDVLLKTGLRNFLYQAHIHIMLISLLISMFSTIIPKRLRDMITLILLLVYAAYNSSNPNCLKSAFLAAGTIVSLNVFKYSHKPTIIGICVLLFGIVSPMVVLNSSFVCCITASCSFYMLGKYVADKLYFISNSKIRYYISATLVCSLSTVAVSSLYFNQITLYNVLFGLICVPLTIILLIIAPIMLIMLALFQTAPIVSNIAAFCVYTYLKLPYIINILPFSTVNLPTASVPIVILNIMLVYYCYLRIKKVKDVVLKGACVLLSIVIVASEIETINTLEMTFVNVGQGDGAVLSIPYRCNILIDGGGGNAFSEYDPGKMIFVPYLKSHGKTKIEAAFVSHFHKDHVEGIIRAVENLHVKKVYAPICKDNELKYKLECAAKERGTEIFYISSDTNIKFKNGLEFDVFTVDSNTQYENDENNEALVIKAKYGEFDCLFTGDMTKTFEDNMIYDNKLSKCEVLKVPHHGSRTSANSRFIDVVSPEVCVISLGEGNMYGFPHKETLDTLSNRTVLRTDECGDIKITARENGKYRIKCYR